MQTGVVLRASSLLRRGTDRAINWSCSMSSLRLHASAALLIAALALGSTTGCRASQQAQLNVLSVEKSARSTPGHRRMVAYVEVVNHARRPMRLQRLQYTFAAAGGPTSQPVELELGRRLVEAGSAIVLEVPLPDLADSADANAAVGGTLTLAGRLYAEQDAIIRSFAVAAEIMTPADELP
jgi:hypothetical protein